MPPVENTSSCREHLQLPKISPVVQSTSSCREHLQLSKVSPVVQSTSSCPKYLQLSITSPVIESTPSCREYLHLSKAPPVVESDFCQTGSVIQVPWSSVAWVRSGPRRANRGLVFPRLLDPNAFDTTSTAHEKSSKVKRRYRVRYWTKWVCTFWGAVVGFMALVILIGVGKKLFGILVLLWLWRFAKEDEQFWLGQFD